MLGRTAHGETVHEGYFRDSWRVRRDGVLVYADETRLDGRIDEAVRGRALLGGMRAFASLLLVSPDAESKLHAVRDAIAGAPAEGGASAWNGMLAVRLVADGSLSLRRSIVAVLKALGTHLPRVWNN